MYAKLNLLSKQVMISSYKIQWILILSGMVLIQEAIAVGPMPSFASPISSLTVAVGRDAVLKCDVDNLGDYRVAWIHVDKQVLLTIHTHVITRSKRVSVSHHDFRTWFLHLRNVKPEDSGYYMCQINTQPMISQVGYLDIVVPPEFVNDVPSRNISIMENSNVSLSCRATGNPIPKMKWRREDGQFIIFGDQKVQLYDGEELHLVKLSRHGMGAYLCIASNGVPPAISRRMYVEVKFPPMIWIPNQLVGAPLGHHVSLECHTEAHPPPTNFWIRDGNVISSSSKKFDATQVSNGYKSHMKLVVKDLTSKDYGTYKCLSRNALGETAGSVNLYKTKAVHTVVYEAPATVSSPQQPELKVSDANLYPVDEEPQEFGETEDLSLMHKGSEANLGHSTGYINSALHFKQLAKNAIFPLLLFLMQR